ncbi:MAG: 1-acyl-sn-glycerol-3-phosphate acyltransferase [Syntrophobacteria bacterium]
MFLFQQKSTPDQHGATQSSDSLSDPGCTLEFASTSLLTRLLERISSRASFLDTQKHLLSELEKQGTIVYAAKYRSRLDFLFLNARLGEAGLRPPRVAFDMRQLLWLPAWRSLRLLASFLRCYLKNGHFPNPYHTGFYRETLLRGDPTVLFLIGKIGYYRRFGLVEQDPLHLFLEIQRQTESPIILVPCIIFHGKGPEKRQQSLVDIFFGNKERPGRLRKLVTFLRNYKHNVLEVAEPLNLREWLGKQENQNSSDTDRAFRLCRELTDRIDLHRRVVTGPVTKSRLELKEIVLHNRRLQNYMERRARSNNLNLEAVRMEADGYLQEIATDCNMTYVQLWSRILTWVWNTLFDGIDLDVDSLNRVKQAAKQAPIVYVPCHKSHIDYLILSYLLYQHNLSPPYVAAGRNLAFWPVGPIFRKSGAFFIRRSFWGQKFYAEVFATYIKTLVQEGYNIEFFIEGGRSRTGKLVLPKLGLLAILIQAVEEGSCDDLIFVPTSLNYDRVLEEGAYLKEVKGSGKQKENISQLVRARRFLKKRYGKVYVQFAEPLSLKQYMARVNLDFTTMNPKERHAMYRDLGWRIIYSINQASLVTPFALVAAAFLTTPKRGISLAEVKLIIRIYYDYLQYRGVRMADTLQDRAKTVQDTISLMEKSKWLELLADEEDTDDEERIYTIDDASRLQLEYYKNSMIHFLLPAAYVSTAILAKETFEFDLEGIENDLRFFRNFFKFEFVYDAEDDLQETIGQVLSYFTSQGFIVPGNNHQGTYRISHQGLKALSSFANLLRNYFEAYWIVLRATKYLAKKPYSERDFSKKVKSLATRLYKQEIIERFESISRITFENACNYYCEKGVIQKRDKVENGKKEIIYQEAPDREAVAYYSRLIDHYLRISQFTFQ